MSAMPVLLMYAKSAKAPRRPASAVMSISPWSSMIASSRDPRTSALNGIVGIAGSFEVEGQGHRLAGGVGGDANRVHHVPDQEEAPAARFLLAGELLVDIGLLRLSERAA